MTAPMDDGTGAADATLNAPTPAWIEAEHRAALAAIAAAQQALRCGQIATVRTKLYLVESFIRAMAPGAGR